MSSFVKKLLRIERRIADEHGPFELFAAFRPDSDLRLWDLLVAAQWLESWTLNEMRVIASELNREFTLSELTKFSRIAIIERDNPGLHALQSAIQLEHGVREFRNVTFFDVQILHAYIITCRHADTVEASPLYAT